MAKSPSNWSEETYRFDEIARKFEFPLLVQVSEGFYRENEVDSFSAGDIIMLDQFVTLQKVAASFARLLPTTHDMERGYAVLKEEILIPLNYKGKLKVENEIKVYEGIREIAKEFPRYAELLETIAAPVSDGVVLNLEAGTIVELDRVIPPQKHSIADCLVINTNIEGHKQVGLNLDKRCKLRSMPDTNEYTLREAVDRYSLPQIVSFLDNKIQSIYTQDLIEGVEQMINVTTSALQIRRVIQQKVLIGHYREPDYLEREPERDSETHCKRTLVVVPLDSSDMREILVNVYTGDVALSNYETMFVKDVNADKRKSIAMAEGLYIEFLKKPRLIRLPEVDDGQEAVTEDEAPPLLPPRSARPDMSSEERMAKERTLRAPQNTVKDFNCDSESRNRTANAEEVVKSDEPPLPPRLYINKNEDSQQLPTDTQDSTDDYLRPSPSLRKPSVSPTSVVKLPTKSPSQQRKPTGDSFESSVVSPCSPPSLADMFGHSYANIDVLEKEKTGTLGRLFRSKDKKSKEKEKNKKKKDKHTPTEKKQKEQGKTDVLCVTAESGSKTIDREQDEEIHYYDEPDLWLKDDSSCVTSIDKYNTETKRHAVCQSKVYTRQTEDKSKTFKKNDSYVDMTGTKKQSPDQLGREARPVAHILPLSSRPPSAVKEFHLLSVNELRDRLNTCGMKKLAEFCFEEKVNGAFLIDMDDETLQSLELTDFQKNKLKKIISGWVPT